MGWPPVGMDPAGTVEFIYEMPYPLTNPFTNAARSCDLVS